MSGPSVWRGSIEAGALLFDEGLLGRAELARRALALWAPGARLRRSSAGVVLVLAASRRFAVAAAPGLPLVERDGALVGFTTDRSTLAALAPPAGALVLLRAGTPVVVSDGRDESLADWLDLGTIEVVETARLGAPAPDPLAPPRVATTHEALGPSVPAPAPEREAIMRAAAGEGGGGEGAASGGPARPGFFGGLFRRRKAGAGEGEPPPASWLQRFADRATMRMGLHRLLGRAHGRYLAEMIEMLEEGELREGLRHAIPLASAKDLASRAQRPHLWGWLRPRANLEITSARTTASSSLMGDGLFERLRALYRATFARLDAQGRLEEAAFVLAELLQEDEEAVAYLERHGQLERAAELAEARRCAPGLVVRAWFLAGDRARAVRVARERGAFADAILRLERGHPAEARALRLLWADALASAGDYVQAVAVSLHLPEAQRLLPQWIDAGLILGEAQAPRLLAYQAALLPERWEDTRERAQAWLDDGDSAASQRRSALFEALAVVPANAGTRLLARRCLRQALARPSEPLDQATRRGLLRAAGDEALEIDLPLDGSVRAKEGRFAGPLRASLAAGGALPVRDGVVLPSGRALLAHGDLGVTLQSAAGSRLHHFDVPADRLVISDAGDRAIALVWRGDSALLAQIDLRRRECRSWGAVELTRFANSYDGNVWFAAHDDRLLAIDVLGATARCFWSVDDDDSVQSLVRGPGRLVVMRASWGVERFVYELPGPTLRERRPISMERGFGVGFWATLDGPTFDARLDPEQQHVIIRSLGPATRELVEPAEQHPIGGAAESGFLATVRSTGTGQEVRLYDSSLTLLGTIDLPAATGGHVRFAFGQLLVSRGDGPLMAVDLERGTIRTLASR